MEVCDRSQITHCWYEDNNGDEQQELYGNRELETSVRSSVQLNTLKISLCIDKC